MKREQIINTLTNLIEPIGKDEWRINQTMVYPSNEGVKLIIRNPGVGFSINFKSIGKILVIGETLYFDKHDGTTLAYIDLEKN